jgi:UrcA family protein
MKPTPLRKTSVAAGTFLAGALLATAAAPVRAESTVGEITVTGHFGPDDNVRSISQTVGFGDLDLSTDAGRHELKHRISLTARYLCDKLGESDTSDGVTPSCRDAATQDADVQADNVIAKFSRTAWVAGPAWAAPYPTTWVETYR